MSESQSNSFSVKRCSLPKFKDKVMYVVSPKGVEQSYTVSSSFKGILRLSPNDVSSINEVEEILQLPEELYEMDTNYSDAIVFEGAAAIKSNASIERRMIIASDSDSYAVDLRISERGVEFDNLNVVGISKFDHLTVFSNDVSGNNKAFKMGNSILKTTYNDLAYKSNGSNYDVKEVDVKKGDESYILSAEEKEGKRVFKYFKTKTFIEELVMEALLDLQTIPTGSIHFVPVTMEQYKKLTTDNSTAISHRPNCNKEGTDPIVRDFLLCDGRKYNRKDYPELAKMLWNEKVHYWKPIDAILKENNGEVDGFLIVREEHKNDYGEEEDDITFRVPDMRRMFISYLKAKGVDGFMEDATAITEDSNEAGYWLPDNVPLSTDGNVDNHFHFIAYGTYTPIVSFPQPNDNRTYTFVKGSEESFTQVAEDDTITVTYVDENDEDELKSKTILRGVKSTGKPAVLTHTNHLSWSKSVKQGPGFGTGTGGLRRREYWGYEPWPAIAYMAGPRTGEKNKRKYEYSAPDVGRTSLSISNTINAKSNDEAYGADKNNNLNYEKYENLDVKIYGHENTPKYVACLPLIKI